MSSKEKPLNERQQKFVDSYIIHGIAERAAQEAGYSKTTSRSGVARILANARVKTEIDKVRNAEHSQAVATYEEACIKLTSIMRGNIGDYLTELGGIDLKKIRTCHPEAVQSFEQKDVFDSDGNPNTITKFRLNDRVRAIERLAKLKGWDQPTKTQVEATVVTTGPDLGKLSDDELETMERLMKKAGG